MMIMTAPDISSATSIQIADVITVCNRLIRQNEPFTPEARELISLLGKKPLRNVISAFGEITSEENMATKMAVNDKLKQQRPANSDEQTVADQTIRIVRFSKNPGLPLGVTVEEFDGYLKVARIISGGLIDKMKLLKVGDIIIEINEKGVSSPKQLQEEVSRSQGIMKLKVVSAVEDHTVNGKQCYMKTLFSYDPALDTLLPCKEIGIRFSTGDVLNVVDKSDPNWWQAKHIHGGVVGLIPSRELEEKRAAFVRPEADFVHSIGVCGTRIARKKKVCAYTAKQNTEFDRAELVLYEEVARIAPHELQRKVLVIVGIRGAGRRTLKTRLINSDPRRYGTIIPVTSRPPREGEEQSMTYVFVDRDEFEAGLKRNDFLEWGENDGHYYGITFASIREVVSTGKTCILDCNVATLKLMHNSAEFKPFVIFLAYPGADKLEEQEAFERQHGYSSRTWTFDRMSSIRSSSRRARTLESFASLCDFENTTSVEESQRLEKMYAPYFDIVIINEDYDDTFRKVVQAVETLQSDYQYVPVSWVY